MTLLVDIGNSRVKWGRLERAGNIHIGETLTTDSETLGPDLDRVWGAIEPPPAVLICNVAGPVIEETMVGWVRRHWIFDPRLIRTAPEGFGVVNGYERSERLGADRWIAMVGVRAVFGVPACLVDCGTAVTVDLVDADGHHRGGLIGPGLRLMADTLVRRASGVEGPGGDRQQAFWGNSTAKGLQSGVLQMVAGLIERAMQRARLELGDDPTLVLTGGDARAISPLLAESHQLALHIVLQGLAEYAEVQPIEAGTDRV